LHTITVVAATKETRSDQTRSSWKSGQRASSILSRISTVHLRRLRLYQICLSACPFVTRWHWVKTNESRLIRFSPETLNFWDQITFGSLQANSPWQGFK